MKKNSVVILGAGTQGRRLAYMWSSLGRPVRLVDQKPSALSAARHEIEKFKSTVGKKTGHRNGLVTMHSPDALPSALKDAWLAVENVPESLHLKRSIVSQLDGTAGEDTIVASNSSSFTMTEIIRDLDLRHASRCVSLHSYWPPQTEVIEVMGTSITKAGIIPRLMEECKNHGFSPFHVKKNSNVLLSLINSNLGIWAAIKREALFVAAEGVALPQEIDAIYKNILRTPKGPFEQIDLVGLDVVKDIEEHYAESREALPQEPRNLLAKMIGEGKLGVKTGEGFYRYEDASNERCSEELEDTVLDRRMAARG